MVVVGLEEEEDEGALVAVWKLAESVAAEFSVEKSSGRQCREERGCNGGEPLSVWLGEGARLVAAGSGVVVVCVLGWGSPVGWESACIGSVAVEGGFGAVAVGVVNAEGK